MKEHPNLIIDQAIFDEFIDASIALYKQLEAKASVETEIITQEETDFVNAFVEYARELTVAIKSQIEEAN